MGRVGNSGSSADNADLPYPFYAERIEMRLALLDEDHVDVMDVGVNRHMVLGEIMIDDASVAVIDHRLFVESHADAADHGSHDLTARGFRIEDTASCHCTDNASNAEHPKLFIEPHLGEYRRMSVVGVALENLGVGLGIDFRLDGILEPMEHIRE